MEKKCYEKINFKEVLSVSKKFSDGPWNEQAWATWYNEAVSHLEEQGHIYPEYIAPMEKKKESVRSLLDRVFPKTV
jgi:hypothetical protein